MLRSTLLTIHQRLLSSKNLISQKVSRYATVALDRRADIEGNTAGRTTKAIAAEIRALNPNTETLMLTEDTPNNEIWAILSDHLSNVKDLRLSSGYPEHLNDNIPQHWPLKRLIIDSACGELVQTPWIIKGRVKHLVLWLTCGLRFEGPTTEELFRKNREAIERGEKKAETFKLDNGREIQIEFLPELVTKDRQKRWANPGLFVPVEEQNQSAQRPVDLETLEILENDAIQQFIGMAMGCTRAVSSIRTLNIRSSMRFGQESGDLDEITFCDVLRQLDNLRTVIFTLGDIFDDHNYLPNFYQSLPRNVETVRFRSSVVLAEPNVMQKWKAAFADQSFLPHLRRLSFILDLPDWGHQRIRDEQYNLSEGSKESEKESLQSSSIKSTSQDDEPADQKASVSHINDNHHPQSQDDPGSAETLSRFWRQETASDDQLRVAKRACEDIYDIARTRGIIVEPFEEHWTSASGFTGPDYQRWDSL